MKIRLAMLGVLFLTSAAQANPSLLISSPEGLRPIANYDIKQKRFLAPSRQISQQEILGQDLLKTNPLWPLYAQGEIQNYFRWQQFQINTPPCVGSGFGQGSYERSLKQPLLGFSSEFPGVRRYIGSYPSQSFNDVAQRMSQSAYRKHGISTQQVKSLQMLKVQPFTLYNGSRVLIAAQSQLKAPGRDCPPYNLLLIFEKVGRRYQTRLERFRRNSDQCGGNRFISSLATDNQVDKIVLQAQAAGAQWYDIFELGQSSFKSVFHGGGHGECPQKPQS